jgi:hypothetical protein
MTPEEKKEFTELKYKRDEQGFFTQEQIVRWNYLFDLQSKEFFKKTKFLEERRQAILN